MRDFSEEAREHLETAAHLLRKVGDIQSLSWANRSLGLLLIGRNEPQSALPLLEKSVEGYRERKATRGLFRSQVVLCECLIALSEYDKVRNLWPEIEELSKRVALGYWTARWRAVQGHCEVVDCLDGKAVTLQVVEKYLESLRISMDLSCSLLYQIADQIVARIAWLRRNGRSREAEFIVNGIADAWINESTDEESPSRIEKRKCSSKYDLSVLARIRSALD